MNQLEMYCLSIHDKLLEKINQIGYIPVGLGSFEYSSGWLRDNTGDNISHKNKNYGEYTFHYWFWKNILEKTEIEKWVGFCAQRRFWSNDKNIKKINNFEDLNANVLKSIPEEWNNYDVIIGNEIKVTNIPWIKIIKYGKQAIFENPKSIFKSKRNIKFQFDMFHGCGLLDKAINLLPEQDKFDFRKFVEGKNSYNQGNMFICKSKKIMSNYYSSIFEWLFKCEKIFGFNLHGYSKQRIYGFLAERYLPYWFSKYSNNLIWPVIFYNLMDTTNEK
tara:strand:- start:2956 stop:3780 length:825 start_codon:yes stop_codon:yes gene_type:complete